MEHPATVMLLLGIDPMANLAPVMPSSVEFYDTRGRRPSALEQIIETENGSQTPSSSASDKFELNRSLSGSARELYVHEEMQVKVDKDTEPHRASILKRKRYSASDICEASERLLPSKGSQPSTYSLKANING